MPDKIKNTDLFLQFKCEGFQGGKKKEGMEDTVFCNFHHFRALRRGLGKPSCHSFHEATVSTSRCFHFPHTNFLIIKGPFQTYSGHIILFAAPNWRTVFVEKNRSLQSFRIKLAHQPLWEEKNYLFYPLILNTNTIKLSFLIVTYFMLNWDKASFAQ